MKTINDVLNQKYENKSKAELVSLLSNLSELITLDEYQKISGVDPKTELDKLTKKDLLAVIDDFRENYNPKWEENIANASTEIIRNVFGMMEADEATFGAMEAGDSNFAPELGNIDFENLIAGPMQAAVKAQNSASLATVAFIKEVGFEGTGPDKKLRMVDFSYKKDDSNEDENKEVEIKVPFISILNIPSLRIETLDIDFNVKLNSTYTRDVSSEFKYDNSHKFSFFIVKFKSNMSYKRTTSTGVKVEKEYSMNVKVKATNDEMPAGLEKVLGMMSA